MGKDSENSHNIKDFGDVDDLATDPPSGKTRAIRVSRSPYHLSYAEVGQILGLSASSVQVIEQRALRKCRKVCSDFGIDPSDLFGMPQATIANGHNNQ
ncbi:MAG: hypothetical protein ING75_05665 [Rhodocyclaceae bacterium]|jgi:hypothetical protein|nr:hypothetical protein [Rhodocyclaceae bacterium]